MDRAVASLHTRLPLCTSADALDEPIGVVNFKELLRLGLTASRRSSRSSRGRSRA